MNLMDKIKCKFEKINEEVEELSSYCIELVPETIFELEKIINEKDGMAIIEKIDNFVLNILRKRDLITTELEEQEEILKPALIEISKKITELYTESIEPFANYMKSTDCCYVDNEGNLFYLEEHGEIFKAINVEKLIIELYIYNSLFDTILRKFGIGFNFTKFLPE